MKILPDNFTYIDLFAGIGGFRNAMNEYSHGLAQCLYASEIDEKAATVYFDNFGQKPMGDIKKIDPIEQKLPAPDVVCGGFPCQTFSKGGNQAGFRDSRGTLFREIIRIINCYEQIKKPKILILENVQNLVSHDSGNTWMVIHREIQEAGYNVVDKPIIVAPKDFGVPQLRNRAIILAVRNDIYDKQISLKIEKRKAGSLHLKSILDPKISSSNWDKYKLSDCEISILNCWQEFIEIIPKKDRVIGFPIWSDEFGKNYTIPEKYPSWKKEFIEKNRKLYEQHCSEIDTWLEKWKIRRDFTPTNRKFEWQAGKKLNSIFEGIIQFRTSGIRVKLPTESPALVAMDHRPIYGPFKRYITPIEASRLQSFPECFKFNEDDHYIYKQLGNAVNVKVIENVFSVFIDYLENEGR